MLRRAAMANRRGRRNAKSAELVDTSEEDDELAPDSDGSATTNHSSSSLTELDESSADAAGNEGEGASAGKGTKEAKQNRRKGAQHAFTSLKNEC